MKPQVESERDTAYKPEYESALLRGRDEPRPWNLQEEITQRLRPTDWLLDIGCGTAMKIMPLAGMARGITGVEPNELMRERALENVHSAGLKNIYIGAGAAECLPFAHASFDVVTCMLAPDDVAEVARVLKPGGLAVVEKIGEHDKTELKSFFGSDEEGPRGHYATFAPGERQRMYEESYKEHFQEVSIRDGQWKTYYSEEGLRLLLENTPTVRGFDRKKDAAAFERAVTALTTPQGIVATQHRFLIIAQK